MPLVKFMAHRFKGYRGVKDPELKKFISKLEYVETFDDLVHSLELINEAMLASLTMDGKKKVES